MKEKIGTIPNDGVDSEAAAVQNARIEAVS